MAVINLTIDIANLVPVNGVYTFTSQFVNTLTNQLISDSKFPQNQVYTTSSITDPFELPVTISDGNYPIENTKIRVLYKDKVIERVISPDVVNCAPECSVFPIVSVTKVNNTTYSVTLSSSASNTFSWKIFNSSTGAQVANGVANVTSSNFNITTPSLATGDYVLELTGTSCRGKVIYGFNVTNDLPLCPRGPILMSILSSSATSLKFQFDGNGVFGIGWEIGQGTNVLRTGVIKHISIAQTGDATFTDSQPTIQFASLPSGTYTFKIVGNTCATNGTSPTLNFTVGGTPTPLAFVGGSPSVTGTTDNYTMSIAINKNSVENTVILNSTTGVYYQNGNVTYTANVPYIKTSLPIGTYIVKVGTLETSIVISNSGGTPCGSGNGPTLGSILFSSPTSLSFLFDGNGITAIKWRIKQGSTILRNSVVYPVNNHPVVTYNELPVGEYTLEIEGDNCTSLPSQSGFSIVQVPQGNNAGVVVTNVGSKYIGIINARFFRAVANSTTGNIRLFYDETSTAEGGSKQVKAWLMGAQLQEINPADITALRSVNGMALPDGNYDFYLYYFPTDSVSSFNQIKPNMGLISGPQWVQNSKTAERVTIEIRTNPTA